MPEPMAPEGFKIAAAAAGIRRSGLDLGLLYSDRPATTAVVFTKNAFPAAPILVTREHLKASGNTTRAVLVNAGNANAVTGEAGMNAARRCAAELATRLGCKPSEVFVSSTGVIGVGLKMDKVSVGIAHAAAHLARGKGGEMARAIMNEARRVFGFATEDECRDDVSLKGWERMIASLAHVTDVD